jgi:hypothetical protein
VEGHFGERVDASVLGADMAEQNSGLGGIDGPLLYMGYEQVGRSMLYGSLRDTLCLIQIIPRTVSRGDL